MNAKKGRQRLVTERTQRRLRGHLFPMIETCLYFLPPRPKIAWAEAMRCFYLLDL